MRARKRRERAPLKQKMVSDSLKQRTVSDSLTTVSASLKQWTVSAWQYRYRILAFCMGPVLYKAWQHQCLYKVLGWSALCVSSLVFWHVMSGMPEFFDMVRRNPIIRRRT